MGELVNITPQTQPNPVLNLYPIVTVHNRSRIKHLCPIIYCMHSYYYYMLRASREGGFFFFQFLQKFEEGYVAFI